MKRRPRELVELPGVDQIRRTELTAHPDREGAGAQPGHHVVEPDAPGRHDRHAREGAQ
jgi:hypothetical protein